MFTILLARQGQTMERGTIVRWNKSVGEQFQIGDVLYDIESEKAVIAIQATRTGYLARVLVAADESVPVGALLAVACESNESASPDAIDTFIAANKQEEPGGAGADAERPLTVPVVKATSSRAVIAVPKARALAAELGVNLAGLTGTGPDGAIVVDDVRRAAAAPATKPVPSPSADDPRVVRRIPLTPIGRSIRAALERGARTPQFTQGILVDASAIVLRKSRGDLPLSYLDLFLDAIVRAARAVPELCARATERELEYLGSIDVSIAAATDHGLLLPVLRGAGDLDLASRAPAWRALIERARAGRLVPDEVSGGTIALSNLGTRGVDYGTPLLPADHAAIVFVGSIEPRPLAVDGRLEARPSVNVAITYDHRVADGVLASQFTGALRNALEQPG